MNVSRQHLATRLAAVSHATWLVQAVRDQGKSFDDPFNKDAKAESGDLEKAEAILDSLLAGKSLREMSDNPAHYANDHDCERALNTVAELERLGLELELP